MRHLIIRNVGPIKEAEIEFKRFNFIIGPQSSGKSTIAKIFSTCSWVEKEVATMMDENAVPNAGAFRSLMEDFHKMIDYFDSQSEILFETDVILISLKGDDFSIKLKNQKAYYREKISYIPSERNSVTLPELQGIEFGQTNLRNYLFDWFNAREFYDELNKTSILDLGVRYYYDPNELKYKDRIEHINGKTYRIPLSSASSGLQSVVPLQIMVQYYSDVYFATYSQKISFASNEKMHIIRQKLTDSIVLQQMFPEEINSIDRNQLIAKANERIQNNDPNALSSLKYYQSEVNRLTVPHRTSFIIEEPEQNLYPFTQMALLEAMLTLCYNERAHRCTITTHSPFILNYLNILIERYYKKVTGKVAINPEELGVFVTNDGHLNDLMQINTKTDTKNVNAEDLVEAMRSMYYEYMDMRGK